MAGGYFPMLDSRFRGCIKIGELEDDRWDRPYQIFYINRDDVVGAILPEGFAQIWPIHWARKIRPEYVIKQVRAGILPKFEHNKPFEEGFTGETLPLRRAKDGRKKKTLKAEGNLPKRRKAKKKQSSSQEGSLPRRKRTRRNKKRRRLLS